jgi:hypothetical protein
MSTNYIELGKSIVIDLLAVIIFAAIVVFGPIVASEYLGLDQAMTTALVGFVSLIAYQVLPSGSVNLYEAILAFFKVKGGGFNKDDKGSMNPIVYFIIAGMALIVVAVLAVYYFNIDIVAAVGGALLLILGGGVILKKKTGVIVKDGYAYITVDEFKGKIIVGPVPTGLLYIKATKGGYTWDELQARYNPEDGNVYSIVEDPFFVKGETDKNDVFLAMTELKTGSEQLQYILTKIAGKGVDVSYVKAVLCLTQQVVDNMKSGKAGPTAYADFINDVNPSPYNLSTSWKVHLEKHADAILKDEALALYKKYILGE